MATAKIVRYTTKPECAAENEQLIQAVFAELATTKPDGLQYAAFRLDDGVSFLHVALLDAAENPLASSAAFGQFQAGIAQRCVAGPTPADGAVVGSYGIWD